MNLVHVRQVLSTHRALVVAGIVLAVLAALFVYGRPGWDGKPTLTPRTPEEWRASSTLFLTQEGFPAGRAVPSRTDPGDDQSRFQSLAVLYAELATSDRVKALAERGGKIDGEILAEPVIYTIGQFATPVVLPMVRISVTADTARAAVKDAGRVSRALQNYVTSGQVGAKIRPKERVLINVSRSASDPLLVAGPSKAVPIVTFVLLLGLMFMAIFAFHNYRVNAVKRPLTDTPTPDSGTTKRTPLPPSPAPTAKTPSDGVRAAPRRPRTVLSAERPGQPQPSPADLPAVRQPRAR